jgi:hypothetical protein
MIQFMESRGVDASHLKEYGKNREKIFLQSGLPRHQIKTVFTALLNLGNLGNAMRNNGVREGDVSPSVLSYMKQFKATHSHRVSQLAYEEKSNRKDYKSTSSWYALKYQEIENMILTAMYNFFTTEKGRRVDVLVFDGLQVLKDPTKPPITTETLEELSVYVYQKTRYHMTFAIKPIEPNRSKKDYDILHEVSEFNLRSKGYYRGRNLPANVYMPGIPSGFIGIK